MARIVLTCGAEVLVDDADIPLVGQYKWHLSHNGYVVRRVRIDGRKPIIYLHRAIMSADWAGDIDHINGDRLDNRRQNLRYATRSENNMNARARKGTASRHKGVTWHKQDRLWWAYIKHEGKQRSLGMHKTEADAARAYNAAAKRLFGDFARLNHIEEN